MESKKITINVSVAADIQKAWDFYTQPEHIIHWNFASDDWHCPAAGNDLSAGGKYFARMEAKDGGFGFDFEGIYNQVITGEMLSYALADGREVSVQFTPVENETEVTVTFDAENENSEELQRSGWQAILNNYKKYTES